MTTPAQTPADVVEVAKRLAERVAELEAQLERREAELHATDLARLEALAGADELADQARRFVAIQAEQAAERDDGRVPVLERDLARLVELARAGAQAGIIAAGRGLSGDDAHLLMTYAELLGLLEGEP